MRLFNNKILKKIVSYSLCAVLVVMSLFAFVPENSVDVRALSSSELQQQIQDFEYKQQQIQNKIDALQGDKDAAKEKADKLQEQVDVIESKVDAITQRVNTLENEIKEKQPAGWRVVISIF